MENEELIRRKMERTRESITEKLDALEDRIVGSVEQASAAVTNTAASVKDAMDINTQIDRHPWLVFGGAMAAGLLAGHLLISRKQESWPRMMEQRPTPAPAPPTTPTPPQARNPTPMPVQENFRPSPPPAPPQGTAPATPGLLSMLEPELVKAKELAIGVTMGLVREALLAEMPPPLASCAKEIINDVTQKFGGRPLDNSALPFTSPDPRHPANSASMPTS